MRFVIAFLVLFMISVPSAAKCSCGGGASAGFNFLGDPSFNVDMTSFDEFSRGSYLANKVEESVSGEIDRSKKADAEDVKRGINNISLDLDDGSRIGLTLYPAGNDLFGRGDLTMGGASEMLGAVGTREGYRLILELVSLEEEPCLYRFDLLEDESAFLGDYVKITPDGRTIRGSASGVLNNRVIVVIGEETRPF